MTISDLDSIRGLDLYLLDQLLKGRLNTNLRVLDVGCGKGRNLIVLERLGFNAVGFDSSDEVIQLLKSQHPKNKERFLNYSIENFPIREKYDYIIANAVLHFAKSHHHFEILFEKLVELLVPKGQLFIRMTSNLATKKPFKPNEDGIAYLPDESFRYLLEIDRLEKLITKHNLQWVEPIKTVNVSDLRSMSTIVLKK